MAAGKTVDRRNNRTNPSEWNPSNPSRWDGKAGPLPIYGRCTEARARRNKNRGTMVTPESQ